LKVPTTWTDLDEDISVPNLLLGMRRFAPRAAGKNIDVPAVAGVGIGDTTTARDSA
jgi:hypothetical protein